MIMNTAEKLVNYLIDNNISVACAESCTGGLIAATLTTVSGVSAVLGGSFVTYSEEAKEKLVGVKPETIKNFGVVSEETAAEMAQGAARAAGAKLGLSVTGYAGPGGGDKFACVGTVCFGMSLADDEPVTETFRIVFENMDRNQIRAEAVEIILDKAYGFVGGK